jgi:hypothetical protein
VLYKNELAGHSVNKPVILRRRKQEDHKFETSLCYITRTCSKKKKTTDI